MKIPNLSDISPELAKAEQQFAALLARENEIRNRYRELMGKKARGASPENQDERVQAVLDGKPIPPPTAIDSEIAVEQSNFSAVEAAKEILARRVSDLRCAAGRNLCSQNKPQHDKAMKRLVSGMLEVQAAHLELHQMKWGLINVGSGLYGIFDVDLEFLDNPTDRSSPLAEFFRECKAHGFLLSLPKELR